MALASALPALAAEGKPLPTAQKLPRWRGFNLLEKFTKHREGNPRFQENDFIAMAEWGFDFVRLPMSYLCWAKVDDWLRMDEEVLKHIDEAVELAKEFGSDTSHKFVNGVLGTVAEKYVAAKPDKEKV